MFQVKRDVHCLHCGNLHDSRYGELCWDCRQEERLLLGRPVSILCHCGRCDICAEQEFFLNTEEGIPFLEPGEEVPF